MESLVPKDNLETPQLKCANDVLLTAFHVIIVETAQSVVLLLTSDS